MVGSGARGELGVNETANYRYNALPTLCFSFLLSPLHPSIKHSELIRIRCAWFPFMDC